MTVIAFTHREKESQQCLIIFSKAKTTPQSEKALIETRKPRNNGRKNSYIFFSLFYLKFLHCGKSVTAKKRNPENSSEKTTPCKREKIMRKVWLLGLVA